MLILLVGLPSSGKTTAAKILEEMGFQILSSGDVIRDEIKSRGLNYTIENDKKITQWFHEEGREALLLDRVLARAKSDKLVWDGPRSTEQLENIKERTSKKPVIIAIKSDFQSRFRRDLGKNRFSGLTAEDMKRRDEQHLDIGTRELMERADFTIDNSSLTKEELRQELERILEDMGLQT
jgi:dephospho-CoA kinase